jgi:hypothetical protein
LPDLDLFRNAGRFDDEELELLELEPLDDELSPTVPSGFQLLGIFEESPSALARVMMNLRTAFLSPFARPTALMALSRSAALRIGKRPPVSVELSDSLCFGGSALP